MAWFSDRLSSHGPGEDDDDWGSDFEGESCSQEIEDNKINEIREASFLKSSPNNFQGLTEDNSQTVQTITVDCTVNATKTGAIPKAGFSYLNNMVIKEANRAFQAPGNNVLPQRQALQPTPQLRDSSMNSEDSERQSQTQAGFSYLNNMVIKEANRVFQAPGNDVHPQRQVTQPTPQLRNSSMNSEDSERQSQTQVPSNNDAAMKKTPRKLKPEAFSFLNKLPQRSVSENTNDVGKEKKTLVPTVFSHSEKLTFSQPQDDTIRILNKNSDEFVNPIASAPPLEDTTSNYEAITEDTLTGFTLPLTDSNSDKENVKPPLPSRPPPVFKYPPETFSSSRSTSIESTSNLTVSPSLSSASTACPKLGHSISSPDSALKYSSEAKPEHNLKSQERNRRSLPSVAVCPPIPKRPLPPLPISDTGNVSRIKSQSGINKLETPSSVNNEGKLEEASSTASSCQTNQLSECEAPIQHTVFQEHTLQEQLILNPQHRLAQILTNQTSVDRAIFLSQQKIVSAITSRAYGSQNISIPRLKNTEESGGSPQELIRVIPGKSFEDEIEQTKNDESERQPSYLEAKEAVNPRRFPDPETLINAMSRPALPQKAAPIQRSVSCNSLVQSIKDLSFSVWSKPEKKRNSDGISLSKKNPKNISTASSSKVKCSAPLSITLIPTDAPIEVITQNHGERDSSPIDEKSTLEEYPWYHNVDAKEGQLRLLSVGQDGTFLIRPCSRPTDDIQNTLCILYNKKIRNLHIRRRADGRYELGTKSHKNFSSLADMVQHHKEVPVEILPHGSTPFKPQLYRIFLRETPPKLQKLFAPV